MSTSPKPSGARRPAQDWAVSTLRYYQPRGVRSQGRRTGRLERRGAFWVLTALFLTATLALVALTLDLGLLCVARAGWRCSANAAALTAAARCFDGRGSFSDETNQTRRDALDFAAFNCIVCNAPAINPNSAPRGSGDLPIN